MRGVPLRIEIGPKDVEKGSVALARRDRPGREGKILRPPGWAGCHRERRCWWRSRPAMLARATAFRDANIHDPKDYEELKQIVQDGWAFSWWCGSKECEAKVKEDTKATTRNIPLDQPDGEGTLHRLRRESGQEGLLRPVILIRARNARATHFQIKPSDAFTSGGFSHLFVWDRAFLNSTSTVNPHRAKPNRVKGMWNGR